MPILWPELVYVTLPCFALLHIPAADSRRLAIDLGFLLPKPASLQKASRHDIPDQTQAEPSLQTLTRRVQQGSCRVVFHNLLEGAGGGIRPPPDAAAHSPRFTTLLHVRPTASFRIDSSHTTYCSFPSLHSSSVVCCVLPAYLSSILASPLYAKQILTFRRSCTILPIGLHFPSRKPVFCLHKSVFCWQSCNPGLTEHSVQRLVH
jgi:hypothetical protein